MRHPGKKSSNLDWYGINLLILLSELFFDINLIIILFKNYSSLLKNIDMKAYLYND